MWKYEGSESLTCNGILVKDERNRYRRYMGDLVRPSVAVFDRDGLLPLNLQRSELVDGDFPFREDIRTSIALDLIRHSLDSAPEKAATNKKALSWYRDGQYKGVAQGYHTEHYSYFCMSSGIGYLEPKIVNAAGLRRAVVFWLNGNSDQLPSVEIEDKVGLFIRGLLG